jgi:NHL repeat
MSSKPILPMLATLAALAVTSAPAQAANHGFTGSFGTAGSGEGEFNTPVAVAVNESNGDVYVVDKGNNRVEWFTATGAFLGEFNGSGTLPNENGEHAPQPLLEPNSIAVDNDPASSSFGDVYVTDAGHNVVDKFNPTGGYDEEQLTETPHGAFSQLLGVAVDGSGNVLVRNRHLDKSERDEISRFDATGTYVSAFTNAFHDFEPEAGFATSPDDVTYLLAFNGLSQYPREGVELEREESGRDECGCATGVAVDHSGHVFVDRGTSVAQIDPVFPRNDVEVRQVFGFEHEHLAGGTGLAVNSATDTVYAADSTQNDVAIFATGATPSPTTMPAGEVTRTTATLHGRLPDTGGETVKYHFAYGIGGHCAEISTASREAEGGSDVSETVTGLQGGARYTVCAVTTSEFGDSPSEEGMGVPLETLPAVRTGPASHAGAVTAALDGVVEPSGDPTRYWVEYGVGEYYYAHTPTGEAPAAALPVSVTANVSELEAGQTYHYRLVAENEEYGVAYGQDRTFTTPAAPETISVQLLTPNSALLEFLLRPQRETTFRLEYGTSTSYGANVLVAAEGRPGLNVELHSMTLTGLQPGAIYYYRFSATNPAGAEYSYPGQFQTAAASSEAATVTLVSAPPLSAAVNPPLTAPKPAAKSLTRGQKLARALRVCRLSHGRHRRALCERHARKTYGPPKRKKGER